MLDKQADGTWAADVKVDPSSVASATDEPAKPIRYKVRGRHESTDVIQAAR